MITMTAERQAATVQVLRAILDTIRDLKEVPSGHLYAQLMVAGCTLAQYQAILDTAVRMGLIEVTPAHLIRWIEQREK